MNQASYTVVECNSSYSIELFVDFFNKRVRIDDYRGDTVSWLNHALKAGRNAGAEKIIVKARSADKDVLLQSGFVYEGKIDRYFNGSSSHLLSKFLKGDRRNSAYWEQEDYILESVMERQKNTSLIDNETGVIRRADAEDAEKLAALYRSVFQVYPVPIDDPAYIKQSMKKGTIYYAGFLHGELVSAASAEINSHYHNAEMTDCATLPAARSKGRIRLLLQGLEEELAEKGIYCCYSLARALSPGMNAAFHQLGYRYTGRLANNCFIFDKLEDMNVWVKEGKGAG